jgi:hypothetical protein
VHVRLFKHTKWWKIKTKKENKKSLVLTYAGCFPEETSKPVATIHPNQRPLNTWKQHGNLDSEQTRNGRLDLPGLLVQNFWKVEFDVSACADDQ